MKYSREFPVNVDIWTLSVILLWFPQQQTIGSTQPVNIDQSYAQPIMNNFELPQQSNMTGKVASDMNLSNNTLSPNQYLQSNNPKEGNNSFALGGNMNESYNSDFDSFKVGGSHNENPLGGIPMGMGKNGQMNTVEEGETSFMINKQKFIFSDRIKI